MDVYDPTQYLSRVRKLYRKSVKIEYHINLPIEND